MPSPKKKAPNATRCAIDRSNNKDASHKKMSSSRERWPSKSSMPAIPYRNCFSVLLRLQVPADTSPRSRQDQHPPLRSPMIDLSYFDKYQRGPATQGICWPTWLSDSSIQASLLEKKNGIPIPNWPVWSSPTPFRRPVSSAPPAANPPGIILPAYPETISCERIKGIHQTAPPHPPPSPTHRRGKE